MKKVKMVLYWCIQLLLITVALMLPAVAQALSYNFITIYPDQLRSTTVNSDYWQDTAEVDNGVFYAVVTLPRGATISAIGYYHLGSEGQEVSTRLTLARATYGGEPEVIAEGESTDSTEEIILVTVPITGDPVIRKGYRYFIWVHSGSWSSYFMGARIIYMMK